MAKLNLVKIKQVLLRQQSKVEQQLKTLEKDDPVVDMSLAESSEPGTDSWLAEAHSRMVAMKENLGSALDNTRKALAKINVGKYGKCENCGKMIEDKRLEAFPTATLCISCSKKTSKK